MINISNKIKLDKLAVAFVFIFSIIASALQPVIPVHAAALTWTGDGDGTSFSDGDNWNTDSAPVDGDSLVFNHSVVTGDVDTGIVALDNDIVDLAVVGISFTGTASEFNRFVVSGNALTVEGTISSAGTFSGNTISNELDLDLTLSGAITVTNTNIAAGNTVTTAGNNIQFGGSNACGTTLGAVLAGSGNVTFNTGYNIFTGNNTGYTGVINIQSIVVTTPASFGSASAGTVVSGSGALSIYTTSNTSISEPLTLGGSGFLSSQTSGTEFCAGGVSSAVTTTFTGGVTLTSNFKLNSYNNVVITGSYTPGSYTFSVQGGSNGTLTTPEGTTDVPAQTINADDNQPDEDETVLNKQTLVLTGTRGAVYVGNGAILKGTGTANSVSVGSGAIIAPGLSPGTLTVLESLTIQGTYQAELLNADTYDRIVAGSVELNAGAELDVVLYEGYDIKKNDQFMIIENTGTDPINGTFDGLDEGEQFEVGNITFSITYEGGDEGNSVIITALNDGSDPNAPNTGLNTILKGNPIVVLMLGLVSATMLVIVARRLAGSVR